MKTTAYHMIELHIKCHNDTDQDEALRDLGINKEPNCEYRLFSIRPELIDGFYQNTEGGCFLMALGSELTVSESYDQIKKILDEQPG